MKTALAFSGGKDSWACLWMNKARLHEITVIWINTGKNYPEMLATIDKAKALCPNFVEVLVDRDGQNAYNGLPSDVVPINWTRHGQEITSKKPVMVQSYIQCCAENIGMNLQEYCKIHGITHLIRGQRNDENHKSSARHGSIIEGIVYEQPIENWTSQQVLDYVATFMDLPNHFKFKHSSMDCFDCTAFTRESKDRIEYTKKHHPDLHKIYDERKQLLQSALIESLKEYE